MIPNMPEKFTWILRIFFFWWRRGFGAGSYRFCVWPDEERFWARSARLKFIRIEICGPNILESEGCMMEDPLEEARLNLFLGFAVIAIIVVIVSTFWNHHKGARMKAGYYLLDLDTRGPYFNYATFEPQAAAMHNRSLSLLRDPKRWVLVHEVRKKLGVFPQPAWVSRRFVHYILHKESGHGNRHKQYFVNLGAVRGTVSPLLHRSQRASNKNSFDISMPQQESGCLGSPQ